MPNAKSSIQLNMYIEGVSADYRDSSLSCIEEELMQNPRVRGPIAELSVVWPCPRDSSKIARHSELDIVSLHIILNAAG